MDIQACKNTPFQLSSFSYMRVCCLLRRIDISSHYLSLKLLKMGFTCNWNKYGFIVLIYLILAIGYGSLSYSAEDALSLSSLCMVLRVFGFFHIPSIALGYYNRKYVFGTKEIVTHTTSWTEEITYYSG